MILPHCRILTVALLLGCAAASSSAVVPTFRKVALDERFFAEGAAFADLNNDGQLDAIAGPFWFAGPEFTERHEIYAAASFDPLQYSDNFFTFTHDFDADGWLDVLIIGFPGTEAAWFRNPATPGGTWERHVAYGPVEGESPVFGKLFTDQPPVLLCVSHGRFGYARFDASDPTRPWTFQPITPPGPWQRFTHGLGFGDVNGDGRNDLLEAGGWWEQPESATPDGVWKQHAFPFASERGGAQMYAFDVNGDGLNDVITARNAHGYGISWYEQIRAADAGISFLEHPITSITPSEKIAGIQFSQPHALVVADVDRDGLSDLVTGKRWWAHGPNGDIDAGGKPVVYAFLLRRDASRRVTFEPLLLDDASGIGTQFDSADVNADSFPDFVVANKRGSFLFLSSINGISGEAPDAKVRSAEEQRRSFHVPPGFEIQLVASEPDIGKPLNLNFDARGQLWVSSTTAYPWPAARDAVGKPIESFKRDWDANYLAFRAASAPPVPLEYGPDRLHVLSDFGPDGRARKSRVFADGLNIPIGVVPLPREKAAKGDSVIAFSIPAIWRFTDLDGDGRADERRRLYSEFGFKDTHGMASNFTYWVDGWIYGTHGFSNRSEVRDASGRLTVVESGNTYRFKPDGSQFEPWSWGQSNPFGLAFDQRGDVFTADSHSKPVYLIQPGGYYEGIGKNHDGLGFAPAITSDDHGSSAIAGIAVYAATQFPAEYRGNLFNGNPVTGRVNRDRLEWTGSTPRAIRMPDFISSTDPAFRPIQVKLGPDGALWISDFYNPIIGHYEVPLTHPARDRAHGRIWRVIWRGLQGEIPVPRVPDFSEANVAQLVEKLSDPNLTVRALVVNELVDRIGSAATTQLSQFAEKVRLEPNVVSAMPLANALERLGATDDGLLDAFFTAGDEVAAVALRILARRPTLGAQDETAFREILARTTPGFGWRAMAEVFARHPADWQAPLILDMLVRTPPKDDQLTYALRVALKAVVAVASVEQLIRWEQANPRAGEFLSGVCLAVPQSYAAEYLLGYLERTQFSTASAGELARHAVQHLPPDRYSTIEPLVHSLRNASVAQQLSLAEGLALATADKTQRLPSTVDAWMKKVLTDTAAIEDPALARRAIEAAEPIVFPEMVGVLRRLATDREIQQYPLRFVALRALPAGLENEDVFVEVLNEGSAPAMMRKLAVNALGNAEAGQRGIDALTRAIPTLPSELAIATAAVLSKSDAGAANLIAEVKTGRTPAGLLTHAYVAPNLVERPALIREQVAALTRNLPSENARLDAVIGARLSAYNRARPKLSRGQEVFTQQCAACHKFRDVGGNIGPTLDGLASRGVARLMEDILDPSRNIDPMFRLTTLTDAKGATQTVMNLHQQGEDYVMNDVIGQPVTLPKRQVANLSVQTTSLMPGGFEVALSEDDLFNVIAFLVSSAAK